MSYRGYSDGEVAEALIRLAANRYDFAKTSEETKVAISTLRKWAKDRPKKGVFELLERALERTLMRVDEVPASSLPVFIGILMDKWLIAQGEPTERHETISKLVGEAGELGDDEYRAALAEARSIIAGARRGNR